MIIIFDLISIVFFWTQLSLLLAPFVFLLTQKSLNLNLVEFLVLTPISLFLGMFLVLIALAVFTRLIGKIEEGKHDFPMSKNAVKWSLIFAIKKFTTFGAISQLIYSFNFFRIIYMWASGAKCSLNIMHANKHSLQDLCFVRIGEGSMIGLGAMIAPHLIVGNKLILKNIVLGEKVQLHYNAIVTSGVEIGDHSIIGPMSAVSINSKIGKNVRLRYNCHVSSHVTIEDDCDIGDNCIIQKGSKISEGISLPYSTLIPENTTVTKENLSQFIKQR